MLEVPDKFGTMSQYDFLYHRSNCDGGHLDAFVYYTTLASAEKAMDSLNKTTVLSIDVVVKLANKPTDPRGSLNKH